MRTDTDGEPARRRRGPELEAALLDAAWDELMAVGYWALTMEGVAARAHTGKMVLYRRWPNRPQLLMAALRRHLKNAPVPVPDTGSLRGDLLALLRDVSGRWGEFAGVMTFLQADFYRETGLPPAMLRSQQHSRSADTLELLLQRAARRGEIGARPVSPRLARLPIDLVRYESLMTQAPLPEAALEEIADTIFLPLLPPAGG
jgi:AcrR family transcriptional regulator